MGNAAGKNADALREAVQVLLDSPLSGAVVGPPRQRGGMRRDDTAGERERGGGRGGGVEVEDNDDVEEEELLLRDVFDGVITDEKAFFEAFSATDATEMSILQPRNLKLLGRKALANISRFMESREPGPPKETLLASVRVLTRVFPAMLSEPSLLSWSWERRSLPYLFAYIDDEEERQKGLGGPRLGDAAEADADRKANSKGNEGIPVSSIAEGERGRRDGGDYETSPSLQAGRGAIGNVSLTNDDIRGGVSGARGKEDEKEGVRGRRCSDRQGWAGGDFTVCFASLALHAITSLLSFPGFSIDEEALDWEDYYTPIPASYYGIRKACVIWGPGVAVTDQNMRQVTFLDSNRIEALRLLTTLSSLPLFLDTPSLRGGRRRLDTRSKMEDSAARGDKQCLPGVSLRNPLTALMTSRHLPHATELFYSLLNLAVVGGSTYRGGVSAPGVGTGLFERVGLVGLISGGGGSGGHEGGSQSLVEWSLQVLALLLGHGRPYGELLEKRGLSIAGTGAKSVYESIPRPVQVDVETDPEYNCYRRGVFMIHSDEDLDTIALGLLRLLNGVRLEKHRPHGSAFSCHPEVLMILSAFVHENPRFVPRLAASEELARGTVVCLCHFLEIAVETMIEDHSGGEKDNDAGSEEPSVPQPPPPYSGGEPDVTSESMDVGGRKRKHPLGEEVGLMVLVSKLLLALSRSKHFMARLVDTPAGGRRGEFSLETEAGASEGTSMTLIELLLSTISWPMASAAAGVSLAAPALAAVARNACPLLTAGMRRNTAEWLLDALEIHLSAQTFPAATPTATESEAGRSPSLAVASILMEGLAAAVAFHHAEQDELVDALTKRYTEAARVRTPPLTPAAENDGQDQPQGQGGEGDDGGILRWLALRGGMLEEGSGARGGGLSSATAEGGRQGGSRSMEEQEQDREASLFADETWFRVSEGGLPWEGWAMRQVIWPLVSRLVGPTANGSPSECREGASALMASAREEVLRPVGLCPPWREEEGQGRKSPGDRAGATTTSSVSRAAVFDDPDVVESGLQMSKPTTSGAVAATCAVLGLAREGVSGDGDGDAEDEQVEVPGIGGVVVGVGPAGFTGGMARPARVVAVEEPWQSIYLWSVVFVRTAWDIRLFDSRTVRLFEIIEDEYGDGDGDDSDLDDEGMLLREGMLMMESDDDAVWSREREDMMEADKKGGDEDAEGAPEEEERRSTTSPRVDDDATQGVAADALV